MKQTLQQLREVVAWKLKDRYLLQQGAPQPGFLTALLNEGQSFVSEATYCNFAVATETGVLDQADYSLNTGVLQDMDIFLVQRVLWDNTKISITDQATLDRDTASWRTAGSGTPKYAAIDFPGWLVLYPKPDAASANDVTGFDDIIKMLLFLEPLPMLTDSDVCRLDNRYQRYVVEYAFNVLTNKFSDNELLKQLLLKERGRNMQRAVKLFTRKVGGKIDKFETY